ncbi:MAG: protein translocase subunit SecF [Bdellovibrionota bacterium]
MELFNPKKMHFPFVKSFKVFVPLSLAAFCICLFMMFVKPGIKYGVDFRGGVEAGVAFKDANIDPSALRKELDPVIPGLSIVEVQGNITQGFSKEFLITGATDEKDDAGKILSEHLQKFGAKDTDWTISKLDSVGPRVGGELKKSALMSIIYTAILIMLYIYIRFDMRYSPGAIVGVLHDLVFTCGFLIISGTEFSTNVVAALLTLAGYSINDTVVVFDRIREAESTMLGKSREAVVDYAINSTLSRTVNTGLTTILSLIILYFIGGPSLRDFSLTLTVGVMIGIYSSIFVASPLYLWGDKLLGAKSASPGAPVKSHVKANKIKEAKV